MKINIEKGLSKEQIKHRIEKGLINYDTTIKTKSVKEIFKTNIFTLFNFINLFLAFLIFLAGAYKNLLFLGTILCNTLIGITQELRSKKIIDKLSLISENTVTAIRESKEEKISINKIIIDDIIRLEPGNQIVTDGIIVDGILEVNEALITGEINPITKKIGDTILSGSYVISGNAKMQVTHIGKENYTYKISANAKYIKPIGSEIMKSLKRIIKTISYIIIPIGILFFIKQINIPGNTIQNAMINTAAALIAIIPDGLMLLTSTVMAISVIKLSKYKVLVQQMYCIENLARIDTICFDKTGTLTKGTMQVIDFIEFKKINEKIIKEICYNLDNHNATMNALSTKYGKTNDYKVQEIAEFSSERKWSGITFEDDKTYIIGAPEIILKKNDEIKNKIKQYEQENRIILLAQSKNKLKNKELPENIEPLGIFLIKDEIRKEASKTINFFEKNDVNVKIISGDNPITISKIAKSLNLSFWNEYIDTSKLNEEQLKECANKYKIFGRVTPQGKKIIIEAMQKENHVVAMTGDGVNDVLALKQSDCAIAVAQGSEAARNVAELVLLDSNFNSIPKIVKEGRRTINNIERSASLFITKTLYALLMLVIFMFVKRSYPFIPIQLTLTSTFTIGIPAFILALEPNEERVRKNFLLNVVSVAFPTALTIVFNMVLLLIAENITNISNQDMSTIAVLLLATTGFMHIYRISYPLNKVRTTLLITMIISFLIAVFGFEKLFSLSIISTMLSSIYLILATLSFIFFNTITTLFKKYIYKEVKK
jgi:cation-transporting ATPase E